MWSLKQGLALIQSHLPSGFDASHGIKSLFPAGYSGSISALKGYVFSAYAQLGAYYGFGGKPGTSSYIPDSVLVESVADTYVMADGAGRWYFSWLGQNLQFNSAEMTSFFIQSGFVFHFSNDGNAHGFVDTSQPLITSTDALYSGDYRSCISGQDDWIARNWPQIFAAGRHVLLWEGKDAPDPSEVWTGAGFAKPNFTQLNGSAGVCAPTISGSTLFPFPSTPVRMLSPAGLVLGVFMARAGNAIGTNPASVPTTLTSGGVTFNTTVPAGMNPGDAGTVECNFSSSDNKINGTYAWDLPGTGSQSNGTFEIDASDGTYSIVYSYKNDSNTTTLTSTVTFAGTDGSSSKITQTAVNGLVRSQTTSASDTNGNTTTTSLTIGADGELQASGSNLNPATMLGVAGTRAQTLSLVANITKPLASFVATVVSTSGPFPAPPTVTIPTQLGPITLYTTTTTSGFLTTTTGGATIPTDQGPLTVSYGASTNSISAQSGATASAMLDGTKPGGDGTISSLTTKADANNYAPYDQTSSQTSQVIAADNSASVTTVSFDADGTMTITITTTDASGLNGTSTTIISDQFGTLQDTYVFGDGGTGDGETGDDSDGTEPDSSDGGGDDDSGEE